TTNKTQWMADKAHSEIGFKVKHMMVTNVSGKFTDYDVTVHTDGEDFETAEVTFSARTTSVTTGAEARDSHLRSADFFDSETYPELKFKSTGVKKTHANAYVMRGDLTIKAITNEVQLHVEFGGILKDPWGNDKAGFTLSGKINRKEWGLNWNAALEAGGVLVSDDVRLNIDIQIVKNNGQANEYNKGYKRKPLQILQRLFYF
ncbi:MAG: YceI family protein, partial [Chitinophagales bacterium]